MNLRPIETAYKGYRFRSRLEARWAVFFDAMGIPWQYEVEGYRLRDGVYLPDFVLWGETHAEVKPEAGHGAAEVKAIVRRLFQFTDDTGLPILLLDGIPEVRWYLMIQPARFPDGSENENSREWVDLSASAYKGRPWFGCIGAEPQVMELFEDQGKIKSAADAARSARFEHGESGSPHAPHLSAPAGDWSRFRARVQALKDWRRPVSQCEATTRKGTRCSVPAEDGRWCHVHDPGGRFQQQQAVLRHLPVLGQLRGTPEDLDEFLGLVTGTTERVMRERTPTANSEGEPRT